MIIAVTLLGETLTPDRVAAFACIWIAVLVFVGDAARQAHGLRKKHKAPPSRRGGLGAETCLAPALPVRR
jgi:hypothetical protein